MRKEKGLQFVWPKDGRKGRDRRGWFGRLDDIVKGKGPDIFIQRHGSRPIRPEQWGNCIDAAMDESAGYKSRGQRRYDPVSRRYEKWSIPHDWTGYLAGGPDDIPQYPRFHEDDDLDKSMIISGRTHTV
ncbi:hypothetical protein B7494_g6858 [Chlorociboria aeruginascens]|nr:hypothetical protein B7494_g6858 [Chlorociboria aeruginascens]